MEKGLCGKSHCRFLVFLARNGGYRKAVEQFFHGALAGGRTKKIAARSSATTMIFAETGAMLPGNFNSPLTIVLGPLTSVLATLKSFGRVTHLEPHKTDGVRGKNRECRRLVGKTGTKTALAVAQPVRPSGSA